MVKLIIYFMLTTLAFSINLEKAITNFKNKSKELENIKKEKENLSINYRAKYLDKIFGIAVSIEPIYFYESIIGYNPNPNQPVDNVNSWQDYVANEANISFVPTLRFWGLNFQADTSIYRRRHGELVDDNQVEERFFLINSIGMSTNLNDLIYENEKNSTLKQTEIFNKQKENNLAKEERAKISDLIDLYTQIKDTEGEKESKERSLIELEREHEYIIDKQKAGSASKIEARQLAFEIRKLKNEIESLNVTIETYKKALKNKIGDFDTLDNIEDISFNEIKIDESNYNNALLQLELDKEISYIIRRKTQPSFTLQAAYIVPRGSYNPTYTKPFEDEYKRSDRFRLGLSFEWNLGSDSYELSTYSNNIENDQRNIELAQQEIEIAKIEQENIFKDYQSKIKVKSEYVKFLIDVVDTKREMYKGSLIDLLEYMKYYNELKNQEIELAKLKNKFNSFKRKILLLTNN